MTNIKDEKGSSIYTFQDFRKKNRTSLRKKITAFDLSMIPRTTIAQSMDILSSMAGLSGYKAIIKAAELLPKIFPMTITAAGSIKPVKVVVLGAGVAGLQAIATAKRLGAIVEASDPRQAAKEEVLSYKSIMGEDMPEKIQPPYFPFFYLYEDNKIIESWGGTSERKFDSVLKRILK